MLRRLPRPDATSWFLLLVSFSVSLAILVVLGHMLGWTA